MRRISETKPGAVKPNPAVLYSWEVIVKYLPGFRNTPEGETHYFHSELSMNVYLDDLNFDKISSVFVNNLKRMPR